MSGVISAIIILLVLGILITAHELGHYLAARLCGIRVREFAIGMGPVLFRRQKTDENGEPAGTKFSLRALPIGGFCDLGEDDEDDDPAHFRNKNIWQKVFVLISGSVMNFLLGFIFFLILGGMTVGMHERIPVITSVELNGPNYGVLQAGDKVLSIDNNPIFSYTDFSLFTGRNPEKPKRFVVLRDGEKIVLDPIVTAEMTEYDETGSPILDEDGNVKTRRRFGLTMWEWQEIGWGDVPRLAGVQTVDFVRIVWVTLGDLISGSAGAGDLMGPVGMGGVVNEIISEEDAEAGDVARMLLQLAGLVAVNLAVVNLLPIPALDGGRILFLFLSAFLVLVRKKPLNAKVEGYIHGVTMILLFALMIFIFYNDITRLIGL